MNILFTGCSSFTGFWFCRALASAGHQVTGPLTREISKYEGVRAKRVRQLEGVCRLVPGMRFGTEPFIKLVRESGPWNMLCHHAAEATNYKSPDFDVQAALLANTLNLRQVLLAFKEAAAGAVVLTGSVFENDEGAGTQPPRAFSGYGLSKGLSWQMFRFYCEQVGLSLGKFVIPNPFGPLEEPRFTAYLMKTWREGRTAAVKTPDYTRDNIHVDLLTAAYVQFVESIEPDGRFLRSNPSQYIETQGQFSQRVAREVRERTDWVCALDLMKQEDFSEPMVRVNLDPVISKAPQWSESKAWDGFVEYYQKL